MLNLLPQIHTVNEMITVEDKNKAFAEKGVEINLPHPKNRIVASIKMLEKKHDLNERVAVLLPFQPVHAVESYFRLRRKK